MRTNQLIILVAVLLTSPAMAPAQVSSVINGPTEASLGDLVVLDGSASSAVALKWLLVNSNKTFLPVDDGNRCVFASGTAGSFHFILVAGGDNGTGGLGVDMAHHVLVIKGRPDDNQPDDPIDPDKPDGPSPPAPGRFGFARVAFDLVEPLGRASKMLAVELAENYESTAAAIAAGGLSDVQAAFADIKDRNDSTLEGSAVRAQWVEVIEDMSERIGQDWDDGKLSSRDHIREVFEEIARGIRAARG